MLYEGLQAMGLELGPEISPVIAVNAGNKENALLEARRGSALWEGFSRERERAPHPWTSPRRLECT